MKFLPRYIYCINGQNGKVNSSAIRAHLNTKSSYLMKKLLRPLKGKLFREIFIMVIIFILNKP